MVEQDELTRRVATINGATKRLFDAVNMAAGNSRDGAIARELVTPALDLLNCGLIALTEIAAAQMAMVALQQADFAAQVEAQAQERATVLATEMVADKSKRKFMGQQQK